MSTFSGHNGRLYALGARFSFRDLPLEDCGDGWDWRAPQDLSYWMPSPLSFKVLHGFEWVGIEPVELFPQSGRVGFPRNLSGSSVLASGEGCPLSLLCEGEKWVLHVTSATDENTPTRILGVTGILHGAEVPITEVLAHFPSGNGVFVGTGTATQVGPNVHIEFDKKGVEYDLR